jgi:hypothetical protein
MIHCDYFCDVSINHIKKYHGNLRNKNPPDLSASITLLPLEARQKPKIVLSFP